MKTVLCVEDDLTILQNNKKMLELDGYNVITAENLAEAKARLSEVSDLMVIVLDIMLPDGNGLDFLRELRESGDATPVIMLTAWGKTADRINGLRAGANDYLGKPFDYEELLARIEAVTRSVSQIPKRIKRGTLSLDPVSGQAFVNGKDALLTKKESAVLLMFMQNEGAPISSEELYAKIWGSPLAGNSRALISVISRLRRKLEGCGYVVSYEHKSGYTFEGGGDVKVKSFLTAQI